MSSPRRRGRRIPPKARGPRPPIGAENAYVSGEDGEPGAPTTAGLSGRPPTRSENRAAKRAASGVRPKTIRGGGVRGRPNRGYNPAVLGLAIAAVLTAAAVFLIGNPFGSPAPSPSSTAGSATEGAPATFGDGSCPTSQPAPLPAEESKLVTIETEKGTIVLRIDGALSPIATGNFVALAECKYYDGVVFHRLVPGFVIQGGDPEGTGSGGPGYGIQDEPITGTYRRGTVAMARTAQPNSQGSQFFIVLDDGAATALTSVDPARGYAILGEVVSGMEVVDAIAAMPNSGEPSNAALEPVAMISVTVADAPSASILPPAATPTPAATSPAATP